MLPSVEDPLHKQFSSSHIFFSLSHVGSISSGDLSSCAPDGEDSAGCRRHHQEDALDFAEASGLRLGEDGVSLFVFSSLVVATQ
jgi:hypothetical protein